MPHSVICCMLCDRMDMLCVACYAHGVLSARSQVSITIVSSSHVMPIPCAAGAIICPCRVTPVLCDTATRRVPSLVIFGLPPCPLPGYPAPDCLPTLLDSEPLSRTGPVYQVRTKEQGWAAPFDHADRFEPLKHLMISDEHNKRMGETAHDYPAANAYMTASFPPAQNKPVRRNPPTMTPAKEGVYGSGVSERFTDTMFAGKGAQVGLGKEGGGPGSADCKVWDGGAGGQGRAGDRAGQQGDDGSTCDDRYRVPHEIGIGWVPQGCRCSGMRDAME